LDDLLPVPRLLMPRLAELVAGGTPTAESPEDRGLAARARAEIQDVVARRDKMGDRLHHNVVARIPGRVQVSDKREFVSNSTKGVIPHSRQKLL